jgi:hypothetical protein
MKFLVESIFAKHLKKIALAPQEEPDLEPF